MVKAGKQCKTQDGKHKHLFPVVKKILFVDIFQAINFLSYVVPKITSKPYRYKTLNYHTKWLRVPFGRKNCCRVNFLAEKEIL